MAKAVCDLCSNPYPYMCAECDDTEEVSKPEIVPEVWTFKQPERQLWVGSGEDFPPHNYS